MISLLHFKQQQTNDPLISEQWGGLPVLKPEKAVSKQNTPLLCTYFNSEYDIYLHHKAPSKMTTLDLI